MNPDNPMTPREETEMRLTAMLMGELSAEETRELQAQMDADPELAALYRRLRKATELLREAITLPAQPDTELASPLKISAERRARLLGQFKKPAPESESASSAPGSDEGASAPGRPDAPRKRESVVVPMPPQDRFWTVWMGVAALLIAFLGLAVLPMGLRSRKRSQATRILEDLRIIDSSIDQYAREGNAPVALEAEAQPGDALPKLSSTTHAGDLRDWAAQRGMVKDFRESKPNFAYYAPGALAANSSSQSSATTASSGSGPGSVTFGIELPTGAPTTVTGTTAQFLADSTGSGTTGIAATDRGYLGRSLATDQPGPLTPSLPSQPATPREGIFTTADNGTDHRQIRMDGGKLGDIPLVGQTFGGSGSVASVNGRGTLSLNGGSTQINAVTVNGGISGAETTKAGNATLTLGANTTTNSFAGGITIASGTTVSGGTLDLDGGVTKSGNATTISGTETTAVTAGNATLSLPNTTGAITKAGAGTLTLSGNNTYTGATTINAGTLKITPAPGGPATTSLGSLGGASATVPAGDPMITGTGGVTVANGGKLEIVNESTKGIAALGDVSGGAGTSRSLTSGGTVKPQSEALGLKDVADQTPLAAVRRGTIAPGTPPAGQSPEDGRFQNQAGLAFDWQAGQATVPGKPFEGQIHYGAAISKDAAVATAPTQLYFDTGIGSIADANRSNVASDVRTAGVPTLRFGTAVTDLDGDGVVGAKGAKMPADRMAAAPLATPHAAGEPQPTTQGPVRIDYGHPLVKSESDVGNGKFDFNVGYQFGGETNAKKAPAPAAPSATPSAPASAENPIVGRVDLFNDDAPRKSQAQSTDEYQRKLREIESTVKMNRAKESGTVEEDLSRSVQTGAEEAEKRKSQMERATAADGPKAEIAGEVSRLKSFLNESARAPELNLFGYPRVSEWPVRPESESESATSPNQLSFGSGNRRIEVRPSAAGENKDGLDSKSKTERLHASVDELLFAQPILEPSPAPGLAGAEGKPGVVNKTDSDTFVLRPVIDESTPNSNFTGKGGDTPVDEATKLNEQIGKDASGKSTERFARLRGDKAADALSLDREVPDSKAPAERAKMPDAAKQAKGKIVAASSSPSDDFSNYAKSGKSDYRVAVPAAPSSRAPVALPPESGRNFALQSDQFGVWANVAPGSPGNPISGPTPEDVRHKLKSIEKDLAELAKTDGEAKSIANKYGWSENAPSGMPQIQQKAGPSLLQDLAVTALHNEKVKGVLEKHGYQIQAPLPPPLPAATPAPATAKPVELAKRVATQEGVKQQLKDVSKETEARRELPQTPPPVPQPEVTTSANAFSTFSLNVSDVSFKLASASLEKGQMPDPSTVRTEEFINAFDYRDPEPAAGVPLAFATERARYPFAQNRDLLRFSVKTAAAGRQPGRPLNLVLLIDSSGSMERADRVHILQQALRVLCQQLQKQDTLSVVTFARTPRLWADGVSGDKAADVTARVSEITPEGGTNIAAALDLGYATALRHYQVGSINRVVMLTDGAANLGDVNPDELKKKVEDNRRQGVALDCFGIGWEGYDDTILEALSRNGDGRYGFLNSPEEAATEFAGQLAGALHVAASDVKVQVEFNPRRVTAYRQIGYAKHQLKKEQFRDNTVDAAEIGAAESGNALYVVEVNPAGEGDLATVRVRFKVPGTNDYREHEWPVPFNGAVAVPLEQASPALRLAGTASAFAEWLVASPYATEVTPNRLLGLLNGVPANFGADPRPKKLEWMIRTANSVSGR